jgi:hypothetical protein
MEAGALRVKVQHWQGAGGDNQELQVVDPTKTWGQNQPQEGRQHGWRVARLWVA